MPDCGYEFYLLVFNSTSHVRYRVEHSKIKFISTRRHGSKCYRPEARGYVIYSPRALPEGAATHEGNESHNHELKADKWLIFTLARIPQGMQKYTVEKYLLFFFLLFFSTPCWH